MSALEQSSPPASTGLLARLSRLESGHWSGLLGAACLGLSLWVVAGRGKAELGQEVERSVQRGIEQGVDSALAPEQLESRSQAAGKGLLQGVVQGALGEARRVTSPAGRAERQALARDALSAADAGVETVDDLRRAALEPGPSGEPAPARRLARVAGETAGDAIDLGFDVLDGVLGGAQRAPRPEQGEDEGLEQLAEEGE